MGWDRWNDRYNESWVDNCGRGDKMSERCKTCRIDLTNRPYVFREGWWWCILHAPRTDPPAGFRRQSGDHAMDELDGFPEPDENGKYDAQQVMDFVKTRNMERAEAIAEAWGTYAVLRFPWD